MEQQPIDLQAEQLALRIEGINNWIKENPDTEANFYEIMDIYVECSKLTTRAVKYYNIVGYPFYHEEERQATHYDITRINPKISSCWDGLSEMLRLRKIDASSRIMNRSTPNFANEPEIVNMFTELSYRGSSGEFYVPENPVLEQLQKAVMCKSVSIPFYIWQVQQNQPDYKYDNGEEFDKLKELYDIYKRAVGIQLTVGGEPTIVGDALVFDKNAYEGPLFGPQIEALMDRIEKNYKYSEIYTSGNQY